MASDELAALHSDFTPSKVLGPAFSPQCWIKRMLQVHNTSRNPQMRWAQLLNQSSVPLSNTFPHIQIIPSGDVKSDITLGEENGSGNAKRGAGMVAKWAKVEKREVAVVIPGIWEVKVEEC